MHKDQNLLESIVPDPIRFHNTERSLNITLIMIVAGLASLACCVFDQRGLRASIRVNPISSMVQPSGILQMLARRPDNLPLNVGGLQSCRSLSLVVMRLQLVHSTDIHDGMQSVSPRIFSLKTHSRP
jgi:hypothetical protein